MNRYAVGLLGMIMAAAPCQGQILPRELTCPSVPSNAVLDRMNLKLAWTSKVRVESNRDGLLSAQILPSKAGPQLVVQTFSGRVYVFDGETGDLQWSTRAGEPFWPGQKVTSTIDALFVVRRDKVFAYNRFSGKPYILKQADDRNLKPKDGFSLPFTPSAVPAVEEYPLEFRLYFGFGDRIRAFRMPNFDAIQAVQEELRAKGISVQNFQERLIDAFGGEPEVHEIWTLNMESEFVSQAPLIYGDLIGLITDRGGLKLYPKINPAYDFSQLGVDDRFPIEFRPSAVLAANAGTYFRQAFLGSNDSTLYAVNLENGGMDWRFQAPGPVTRRPEATDRDVFTTIQGAGLYRLDRLKGRAFWRNRDADRFLAVNQDYVYAVDDIGRFLVLDAIKGTTLATFNLSDWKVPVPNVWTDRVYFANHDGQILCMHAKNQIKPLRVHLLEEPVPPITKIRLKKLTDEMRDVLKDMGMKDEKKDDEKKDDEKKDEKKADKAASITPLLAPAVRGTRAPLGREAPAPILLAERRREN